MVRKILNLILLFVGTLCAMALMNLTYEGFQKKLISKHFSMKKIDTEDAKMMMFFKFGLYFALYAITLKVFNWILSIFDRLKSFSATIQRIILNSYEYFIIFMMLLFYLLRNKEDWNIKQKVPLFGFWFIFGRIIYTLGYLLTTLTTLNFKVAGVAMTYLLLSLMVAEAFNYNGFQVFNMIGTFVPDL